MEEEYYLGGSLRDEESLFSRGEDGRLIRREEARRDQFEKECSIFIDGHEVKITEAVPVTDRLGNILYDGEGEPIPRLTTIYDAAQKLVKDGIWAKEELQKRIPLLCHQSHLTPIAVCRMCSVHICKISTDNQGVPKKDAEGKEVKKSERKLYAACHHPAIPNQNTIMRVTTRVGPEQPNDEEKRASESVRNSTSLLAELLAADHLPASSANEDRFYNELREVHKNTRPEPVPEGATVPKPRFLSNPGIEQSKNLGRNAVLHPKSRPLKSDHGELPYASKALSLIQVDHDRCILCDRCVRSCTDVREFKIIGHTGKGYRTRISFDLDEVMNESGCVQCGECMTSCPTGALMLNRRAAPDWKEPGLGKIDIDPAKPLPPATPQGRFPSAQEMRTLSVPYVEKQLTGSEAEKLRYFQPFKGIPFAYLRWNEGAVVEREFDRETTLCVQNEYGSTAFILLAGEFEVKIALPNGEKKFPVKAGESLILGELACLSNRPRAASIVAKVQNGVRPRVLEVRRNMLSMLLRNQSDRQVLAKVYRQHAISDTLRNNSLFRELSEADRREAESLFLNSKAVLMRRQPGECLVAQGAPASYLYLIRFGFVKVTKRDFEREETIAVLRENDYFGEIALISEHPLLRDEIKKYGIEVDRRTASCFALDDVEVLRVPRDAFESYCKINQNFAERLAKKSLERVRPTPARDRKAIELLDSYVDQGLYQAQNILVLDLERCTRCDECTKACSDAHGPGANDLSHSRLLREGARFGSFLVATACRSCHMPYCMNDCPVDAIHRGKESLEIRIENHCIGCGLCERNCPYGSIQMVPNPDVKAKALPGATGLIAQPSRKALNCDLCQGLIDRGEDTFCVHACPHEAAFRFTDSRATESGGREERAGEKLMRLVTEKTRR